jgi:hypothetical protein
MKSRKLREIARPAGRADAPVNGAGPANLVRQRQADGERNWSCVLLRPREAGGPGRIAASRARLFSRVARTGLELDPAAGHRASSWPDAGVECTGREREGRVGYEQAYN